MTVESVTYISDLNASYPNGAVDPKSEGDNHIRNIKTSLLTTFPNVTGAVTATHAELNYVDVTTAGTAEASKAVVLDASKAISGLGAVGAASLSLTTDLAVTDGGTGASTAADARTNLGLGTMATQASSSVSISGGSISGITDLAVADGGTGASDAATARTNLGLGTMATQASSSVSITGGSIAGITDLAVADGGTGASTAAGARTNLGLGGLAVLSSVTGAEIDADAVGQSEIAASAVGQGELKTALQQTTGGSGATNFLFTGGQYTLGWGAANSAGDSSIQAYAAGAYTAGIRMGAGTGTFYFQARYIQASPPFDLGDGVIPPLFVFAIMSKAGNIEAIDVAETPPWIYNGPTKVTADRYGKDGRQYIKRVTGPRSLEALLLSPMPPAERAQLRRAIQAEARVEYVELTPLMKNADMGIVPHPFIGNDLTGKTVVLLDAGSKFIEDLLVLREAGENTIELVQQHAKISNNPLKREGPAGVQIVGASWK